MPSVFSHALVPLALGQISFKHKPENKLLLLASIAAAVPDLDAIGYMMGVPYGSMWGHRGIMHSFFFAALLALVLMLTFYRNEKRGSRRWWAYCVFLFVSIATHPLLDAMTNGGRGVAFFAPFSNMRYFFPFRPIQVSPLGITRFFSEWGWRVIQSEFIWIWIPCLFIIAVSIGYRKWVRQT